MASLFESFTASAAEFGLSIPSLLGFPSLAGHNHTQNQRARKALRDAVAFLKKNGVSPLDTAILPLQDLDEQVLTAGRVAAGILIEAAPLLTCAAAAAAAARLGAALYRGGRRTYDRGALPPARPSLARARTPAEMEGREKEVQSRVVFSAISVGLGVVDGSVVGNLTGGGWFQTLAVSASLGGLLVFHGLDLHHLDRWRGPGGVLQQIGASLEHDRARLCLFQYPQCLFVHSSGADALASCSALAAASEMAEWLGVADATLAALYLGSGALQWLSGRLLDSDSEGSQLGTSGLGSGGMAAGLTAALWVISLTKKAMYGRTSQEDNRDRLRHRPGRNGTCRSKVLAEAESRLRRATIRLLVRELGSSFVNWAGLTGHPSMVGHGARAAAGVCGLALGFVGAAAAGAGA